jgi:hypothetical protein
MRTLLALRATGRLLGRTVLRPAFALIALTGLSAGYSIPAFAILSCEAGAGPTVSGGSAESCGLNKYSASAVANVNGAGVGYVGSATVTPSSGSQGGRISIFDNLSDDGTGPPVANGRFYANLLVDFKITGPASGNAVPVTVLSGVDGGFARDCVNCEASISYLLQLERPGFKLEVTGGRTLNSNWVTNTSLIGATGALTAAQDGFGGAFAFDAAGFLGQNIRLTSNLSGTVAFTGPNAPGAALAANASQTALFNVILPAGYSIVAEPAVVPLLTNPVLVPEPGSIVLLSGGLVTLLCVARRNSRRR